MAKPVSAIESHPMRQKIVDALMAGQTLQQIAAWLQPPVSTSAICRWRRNATATLRSAQEAAKTAIAIEDNGIAATGPMLQNGAIQAATRAALQAAVDPFVSRIMRHQATIDGEIQSAAGDGRTVAALVSTDLKGLELQARLAGRLDAPGTASLSVQIVYPARPVASEDDGCVTIDLTPER